MPSRDERFFWMFGESLNQELAERIGQANIELTKQFKAALVNCTSCVQYSESCNYLWLFRLQGVGENTKAATDFGKVLEHEHIPNLVQQLKFKSKQIRPRTNYPTPLIKEPYRDGNHKVDIGLHAVRDECNGMLVAYAYYETQAKSQPWHFQPNSLYDFVQVVEESWNVSSCSCHHSNCPECRGKGCWHCFQLACAKCSGTGWKDFARWAEGGYRIRYGKYPLAVTT